MKPEQFHDNTFQICEAIEDNFRLLYRHLGHMDKVVGDREMIQLGTHGIVDAMSEKLETLAQEFYDHRLKEKMN